MKLKDKLHDSYLAGVILAAVILPLSYLGAEGLRSLYVNYKHDIYLYPPPAVQLITLLISVIFFRIIMINFAKEKTGKGYFFVVAVSTFVYFFIYNKMKNP